MGLIKAGIGALGGTLADQWKEFFYCDALSADVLVVKGEKRTTSRSSNTKGNDNIISNGSGIAVADGQCMIIVDQGKVVELCAEPGEFTYDSSSEPSIFSGSLGKSIIDTFKTIGKRFTYGGDTGKDQRVYYFNTKEIMGNKYGTANPIMFRTVDRNIGLDMDVHVRCSGLYSYRIANPIMFYTNVCGNVADEFTRDKIDEQLKGEFVTALTPALAKLSALELRPSAIPGYVDEIRKNVNEALASEWDRIGLEVVKVTMNPPVLPDDEMQSIQQLQKAAVMRDPTMGAATLVTAQGDAMRAAANNSSGAMTGFMGMGMAMNAGGMNASNLYAMGGQQQAQQPKQPEAPAANGWKCECGAVNTGKFCAECGKPQPKATGWTCSCGAVNKGKFCSECGAKKPESEPLYKCDKCGWEPEDPKNPPKFCPECGDKFDANDIK